MKKNIILLLLSFISIYSCTQQGKDCLYHIKFGNWQWDYCKHIGYDTIPGYSKLTGEHIKDTLVLDTAYMAFSRSDLTIPFPIPNSFTASAIPLTVTSADGTKKFEVEKFALGYFSDNEHDIWISGSMANSVDLKNLQKVATNNNPYGVLWLKVKLKGVDSLISLEYAPIKPVLNTIENPNKK